MRRRYFGRGMWFGALCGAVVLTRLERAASAANYPFSGGLVRRVAKLLLWVLPVLWTMYSLAIIITFHLFSFLPAVALPLGLVLAVAAGLQTLKYAKMAIFGRNS